MSRERTGFTLIELAVVLVIIGILAAIAIPNFLKNQAKAKQTEAKTNLGAIHTTETGFFSNNHRYGNFTEISWTPMGTPRYHYQLGAFRAAGDNVNMGAFTVINSSTPIPECPNWTRNLNGAMDNGTTAVSVAPGYSDTGFSAGAGGVITGGGVDGWTINERKILIWTNDGT